MSEPGHPFSFVVVSTVLFALLAGVIGWTTGYSFDAVAEFMAVAKFMAVALFFSFLMIGTVAIVGWAFYDVIRCFRGKKS